MMTLRTDHSAIIPALGEAMFRLPPAGTKFRREAKAGIHPDDRTVGDMDPGFRRGDGIRGDGMVARRAG
jgi:hypothetical protein